MKRIRFILTTIVLYITYATSANGQIINTFAGITTAGYAGDGGPATAAKLSGPHSVATDAAGNVYIADYFNNVIRKVNTLGIISTFAGTGTIGYSGDGGPATAAKLYYPISVAVDAAGNVYIADELNDAIRKVSTLGVITTVAGNGTGGYSGDGGPATAAEINWPAGITVNASGDLYIADYVNNRVRKVDASGIITTVAGNGTGGYSGDGGPATAAKINQPHGIWVDAAGNVFFGDTFNNRIREINNSGIINTVAGNGTGGYSGDGGPATAAKIYEPVGVITDIAGNIYISDFANNRIRKVNTAGIISTIAGNGTGGYSGDGGPATAAEINNPYGVALGTDSCSIYIADAFNNRVRLITMCVCSLTSAHSETSILCNGGNNGTATINANLGNAPYTYLWSNGQTSSSISGLSTGTYICTVTDSGGCKSDDTITITQPSAITLSAVSTNATCGGNTGLIAVSVAGGTPNYTYNWSPSGGNADTAKNLSAGLYTVTVTDAHGCSATLTDTLVQPVMPVPIIAGNHPICAGTSITITASGGSTYLWNNGTTTSSITVTPSVNTTYSVQISKGPCIADTNFNVIVLPLPTVSLKSNSLSICVGDSSTITASGGNSYLWSNGSTNATITVNPPLTTTYTVQVNNGSCTKDTTVTVMVNTKPVAVISGSQAICYGSTATLDASGGEAYEWLPPAGLNCDTCATVIAGPAATTTYTVVALNGNCPDSATATVSVFMPAAVSACCNDTIQMGDTASLMVAGNGSGNNYYWNPSTSCDTCQVTKVWPQFTTTYTVSMSDSNGCLRIDSVHIFVEGCSTAWIPNAFSPNRDNINQTFGPKGVCIVSYSMYIFNRWGELLYHTDASKPWDGTYKGRVVQEDTYVYKILIYDGLHKTHTYIGRVTLVF